MIFANSNLISVPAGIFTALLTVKVIVCPKLLAVPVSSVQSLPGTHFSASLKKPLPPIVVPAGKVA